MDARNFLKVKNFKIKEGSYTFEDVKYLSAAEKKKSTKDLFHFSIITSNIRTSQRVFTNIVICIVALLPTITSMAFTVNTLQLRQLFKR